MYASTLSFPGNLFGEFERLHRDLDALFNGGGMPSSIRSVAAGSFPPLNVGHTSDTVEIYAFAPGLDASQIDVTIDRGILRISGERVPEPVDEKATVYSRERPTGRFERAVALPDDADAQRVSAKYTDGVLRVSLPRTAAAQPQRIAIQ